MPRPPDLRTLDELKAAVGEGAWLEAADAVAPYLTDFRRLYHGATPLVLLPRDVAGVAQILKICERESVAVVPHGGNTGYCGGATPDEEGTQIVLSLRRLNRVRQVDAANYSMIIEAGCTLAEAQGAAREADRLFPLSLGSEGTAQIGGNLSTNAGGTAVLRYGMMRDLVLGLEVVLADGRVLHSLKSLRKDNTGYDVKSLFIGAEGTLGVITAACLKLFPMPADTATALVGIDSPQHALDLLARLRTAAGDQVTSFELLPRLAVELTVKLVPGVADPLEQNTPWYLLIELSSPNPRQELTNLLTATLERPPPAARSGTPCSQPRSRRRKPCGSCAKRCPRRSAATARASSTMSRCRSRRSRRSSRMVLRWCAVSLPRATSSRTAMPATATCISM
jgi:FAD/FMN-containing dehydrogenase